jgi:tetratricopeptide (TPR) repeat protein
MLTLLLMVASARACMWDYDTLRDERRGLPGVAEILAGRWEKHSQFFYEDRVRRMNELIAREPNNLDAFDNLAVAYEKLGQVDKAIETILAKDKLKPGEYTTHANLGTFYLHSGRLEEGIAEIEKALVINPDAHFGREKYQLQLAKYLLGRKDGVNASEKTFISMPTFRDLFWVPATTSPADREAALAKRSSPEFRANVARAGEEQKARLADREHAIEGIVGMIRFGTGKSPDLYAALGELLASRRDAHLAYRAFKRAADLEFRDLGWLREQMVRVSEMTEDKSEFDPALIAKERADADAWVAAYQSFEDELIRAGKDPVDESLFAPFYAAHGTARESITATVTETARGASRRIAGSGAMMVVVIVLVLLLIILVYRGLRPTLGLR